MSRLFTSLPMHYYEAESKTAASIDLSKFKLRITIIIVFIRRIVSATSILWQFEFAF